MRFTLMLRRSISAQARSIQATRSPRLLPRAMYAVLGPLGRGSAPAVSREPPHPPSPPLHAHPHADRVWAAPAVMIGDGMWRAVVVGREGERVTGRVEEPEQVTREAVRAELELQVVMQDADGAVVTWNRTSRGDVKAWQRALLLRARAHAREKRKGEWRRGTGGFIMIKVDGGCAHPHTHARAHPI